MKLRNQSILVVNLVSSCLSFFLSASTAATYIFTAPKCTTIIVSLEPCALNAEFQHLILSCSISYSDLIKYLYFADTVERGDRAWKEAERQGEDRVTLQITLIENWYWLLVFPRVSWLLLHEASIAPLLHYPPQLLVAARRFVRSSPLRPQHPNGKLPSSLAALSESLSLSLRLLTFVACSNNLDSSLSFFPHLSLHSCVYMCIHLHCFYKHNCIPISDSCFRVLLEFPFCFFEILEERFRELVSSFWVIGDPGFFFFLKK